MLIAFGTLVAACLGYFVGRRGSLRGALSGFAVAGLIALGQFVLVHPRGLYASSAGWPWGAGSLVCYVLALAAGVVVSLRR